MRNYEWDKVCEDEEGEKVDCMRYWLRSVFFEDRYPCSCFIG